MDALAKDTDQELKTFLWVKVQAFWEALLIIIIIIVDNDVVVVIIMIAIQTAIPTRRAGCQQPPGKTA